MSYGQNGPRGLQPIKTLNGAAWNSQVNPYLIQSGYPNNIFRGDPVIIGGSVETGYGGYVLSLYDFGGLNQTNNTGYRIAPSLGVFDGCEFIYPTATNNIDPASPGKQQWIAGTVTFGGKPAVASVVDDPSVVFDIQTNGSPIGITQSQIGAVAAVVFDITTTGGIVNGNTFNGQSKFALNQSVMSTDASNTNNYNLKILRLSLDERNFSGQAYNNVEVILNNHFYASRPLQAA